MPNVCVEGQGFGYNFNPSYKADGLAGHTGLDWSCGYGTPIHSPYDGIVTLVWTPQKPAGDGYTAVCILVDDGNECFEFEFGHCNPAADIYPGKPVHRGDVIGTEANHGTVYSGNILITLAMQKAGDQRGHHRHYQKRPCMPVLPSTGGQLISSNTGQYRDQSGFYYQIFNYENGYDGCIDPMRPVFYRDLTVGMSGYDVWVLQRILCRKGFLSAQPTGYFGAFTALAVAKYQTSLGITPTSYFGPLTKAQTLRELAPLPVLSNQ